MEGETHAKKKRDDKIEKNKAKSHDTAHECLCGSGLQATHPGESPMKYA